MNVLKRSEPFGAIHAVDLPYEPHNGPAETI